MALHNYITITERALDGSEIEYAVSFKSGEVRGYFYRLGDSVYVRKDQEEPSSTAVTVLSGISLSPRDTDLDNSDCDRYFRILLLGRTIISVGETTKEDFDALEREQVVER